MSDIVEIASTIRYAADEMLPASELREVIDKLRIATILLSEQLRDTASEHIAVVIGPLAAAINNLEGVDIALGESRTELSEYLLSIGTNGLATSAPAQEVRSELPGTFLRFGDVVRYGIGRGWSSPQVLVGVYPHYVYMCQIIPEDGEERQSIAAATTAEPWPMRVIGSMTTRDIIQGQLRGLWGDMSELKAEDRAAAEQTATELEISYGGLESQFATYLPRRRRKIG